MDVLQGSHSNANGKKERKKERKKLMANNNKIVMRITAKFTDYLLHK
jgi:hypothetical protein